METLRWMIGRKLDAAVRALLRLEKPFYNITVSRKKLRTYQYMTLIVVFQWCLYI